MVSQSINSDRIHLDKNNEDTEMLAWKNRKSEAEMTHSEPPPGCCSSVHLGSWSGSGSARPPPPWGLRAPDSVFYGHWPLHPRPWHPFSLSPHPGLVCLYAAPPFLEECQASLFPNKEVSLSPCHTPGGSQTALKKILDLQQGPRFCLPKLKMSQRQFHYQDLCPWTLGLWVSDNIQGNKMPTDFWGRGMRVMLLLCFEVFLLVCFVWFGLVLQ